MKEETKKKYEITEERLRKIEESKHFVKMCTKCFNRDTECKCENHQFVSIDEDMFDIISMLNKKGYKTLECCSGHVGDVHFAPYIKFAEVYDFNTMPATFVLITTFTDTMFYVKDLKKRYMRFDEEYQQALISLVHDVLYDWVKELNINDK